MPEIPKCQREPGRACVLCDAASPDPCPLEVVVQFDGPPIGAVTAVGTCSTNEECTSCQ